MYELQVEGMSCSHCVSRVSQAVRKIDEAAAVDVDLAAGKVRVDSRVELGQVSAAIAEAGYPVTASRIADREAGAQPKQ
jgi:copper chaperone